MTFTPGNEQDWFYLEISDYNPGNFRVYQKRKDQEWKDEGISSYSNYTSSTGLYSGNTTYILYDPNSGYKNKFDVALAYYVEGSVSDADREKILDRYDLL
jgi:hypothetical protein